MDGTSAVLGYAAPEVVAPSKVGNMVGKELNRSAAEYNEYGGHRTLSEAGGDSARGLRESLASAHVQSQDANIATGLAVTEKSVVNTADAALSAIVMPPYMRDLMAQGRALRGQEGGGGIAGTGISVEDAVLPSFVRDMIPGFSSPKREDDGPTYVEMMNQQLAKNQDLMRRLQAGQAPQNAATAQAVFGTKPAASPYTGMFDHADHVRKD